MSPRLLVSLRIQTLVATRLFSTLTPRQADFTYAVIGAGAVGLAIARQLAARQDTSTLLIERHGSVGIETSSRNSEVIHAGLYYGHGSHKTTLCLQGKKMMYDLCAKQGIPHRQTGKWIIAQQEEQMRELQKVHEFASSIDVPTRFLSRDEIARREPEVRAEAGVLESESTGIVDSHALMAYLEGDFQARGGDCVFHTAVSRIEPIDSGKNGYRIYYNNISNADGATSSGGGGGQDSIVSETLINSAGLSACDISNLILPKPRHVQPHFAKGSYYSYSADHPKPRTLLYPAPEPGAGGLGTHLTLDMAGRVRFGPDVEWVDDPSDLTPNSDRAGIDRAISVIRTYLPAIHSDAIGLDYCGIRPKIGRSSATAAGGKDFQDFVIRQEHDFPGFVNLLAIESPGLTSCLAIGEMVDGLLYR